jgi:hypothetical protein
MPFRLNTHAKPQSSSFGGIHYDELGRIGDIARRGFYPQQAATLKKDEIQRLNAELDLIAKKMQSINDWIDLAARRAAKSAAKAR